MIEPYYQSDDGAVTLYCADCLAVMPQLEGVDAVVTDPPYGVDIMLHPADIHVKSRACVGREYAPVIGNEQPFDPLPWCKWPIAVLWGANHYAHKLPHNGKWLIWDKRGNVTPSRNQADCELAWINRYGAARIMYHVWDGMIKASERGEQRTHPTQKPVAVMRWSIDQAEIPEDALVLDPFMGSGTTGVACVKTGRRFIGIEISEEYCAIAKRRIVDAMAQGRLFDEGS